MAGSPDARRGVLETELVRFDPGVRMLHWAHALPFLLLLLTGLSLFIPPIKALHVGGFRLLPLIHVLVGIGFILSPVPLFLALRRDSAAGRDLHRLFSLSAGDGAWARYALVAVLGAKIRMPPTHKFNLGQKANAAFTIGVTAGLMASGAILAVNFFTKRIFSAAFVERVFPFHDVFMLISLPVLAVHIYLGSLNPATRESFRGITRGRVRRAWALAHHGVWVSELDADAKGPGS